MLQHRGSTARKVVKLGDLHPGQVAQVVALSPGAQARHLADRGLTPGARVACLGPPGCTGSIRVLLRGSPVALRARAARLVTVRVTGESAAAAERLSLKPNPSALAAALLLAAVGQCSAARPLATDDPGTTPRGKWCTELSLDQSYTHGERETTTGLAVLYGLGERSDVSVEIPYTTLRPSDDERLSGFGEVSVAAKWRLRDESEGQPALGISVAIGLPYGAGDICGTATAWGLDLLAAKSAGATSTCASLGFGRDTQGETAAAWGLALERPLHGRWGMAAEIRGEDREGEDSISGLAGLTYRVRSGVVADIAVRREHTSGQTGDLWTVGVTREW